MTKVGVGRSKNVHAFEAGVEAAQSALKQAGIRACDFVFMFATMGYEQEELLRGVRSMTKNASLIGCTFEGIIVQEGGDENLRRMGVMVISSDEIAFTPVVAEGLKNNSLKVGKEIGRKLNEVLSQKPQALIMLPDGLTVNSDALFRGLENTLQGPLPFVGGTSGGTLDLKGTNQYFNGQVLEDSVPCVLVSGDFQFKVGVSHGAQPTGIVRTITKAEGNHLYEIDGQPAFEIFKEFLGEEITELSGLVVSGVCLGIEVPKEIKEKYEDVILRIPISLDKKDGSLYMTGEWPVGTKISICQRNPERIIQKTKETAQKIKAKISQAEPMFVLNFNCAGRGRNLIGAETAEKEVRLNQEILGKDIPWLGGYTFGEIAPIGKKNCFHNWTDVLFVAYR